MLSGCDMLNGLTPDLGFNSNNTSSESHKSESSTNSHSNSSNQTNTSVSSESSTSHSSGPFNGIDGDKDDDGMSWVIQGDNMLKDFTINYWLDKPLELTNRTAMRRTSISEVRSFSPSLASTFENRGVRSIFRFDGLVLGGRQDIEWAETFYLNGELLTIPGSYCFKITKLTMVDEEGSLYDSYFSSFWIPDGGFCHTENLTPDTMYWDNEQMQYNNPCAKEKGVYTVIACQFNGGIDNGTYGIGLIKTADWN